MTKAVMAVVQPAPAKINLFLHVVGRRADGYHELESLVAFTAFGDTVRAEAAETLSLQMTGPFASDLAATPAADNLVMRAAADLARHRPGTVAGARLILDKRLPVASGIGGGSADAAATLHALNRLWRANLTNDELARIGLPLGADIPVCIHKTPAFISGIGEIVEPLKDLPRLHVVLVNPGIGLPTPQVYKAFAAAGHPLRMPAWARLKGAWHDGESFIAMLKAAGNDLESSAITLCPPVAECLSALAGQPTCKLARMSGSGATSFGLFMSAADAQLAARFLARARPEWWVVATQFEGRQDT